MRARRRTTLPEGTSEILFQRTTPFRLLPRCLIIPTMTLKPRIWFPISLLLAAANVVGLWLALREVPAGPLHAAVHAALAVAFGSWALQLRRRARQADREILPETIAALDALEAAETESARLRQELDEARDRLDFMERVLEKEPRREGESRGSGGH